MGRTPTRNKNLPAGMRARHRGAKTYYFLDTGARPRREIPLGQDYVAAVQKWAELTTSGTAPGNLITFRHVAERYQREVLPAKAPATRALNLRELANLYKFFDDPPGPLELIDPIHVRQYLDWRAKTTLVQKRAQNEVRTAAGRPPLPIHGKEGQVPANREKALFSHIWNFAREKGLTGKANPCAGIKGYREDGRDIYVDDEVYQAVRETAEEPLRDALDLAYLTGQRPADVLKVSRNDIKDGALSITQGKTGKKLRISIEGQLAALVERIKARKVTGITLITAEGGTPMTRYELRGAFDRARAAAATARPALADRIREFQFRDLRAKAGTDKEESSGMAAAQDQLGHSTPQMTAHYVRHRRGKLVKPTK
jgi:integrase